MTADEQFRKYIESLPDKHWAKYDLSAVRLGWDAALNTQPPVEGDIKFQCCPIYGNSPNSVCNLGTKGCVEKHNDLPVEGDLVERITALVEDNGMTAENVALQAISLCREEAVRIVHKASNLSKHRYLQDKIIKSLRGE